MTTFKVSEAYLGMRLDVYVTEQHTEYARSMLSKLFKTKDILLNGKPAKPSNRLRIGDKVSINTALLSAEPPAIELPILFEDKDVIVINKPAGILSHSKGSFNDEATVASFIKDKIDLKEWSRSDSALTDPYENSNNAFLLSNNRAGIVHRLDRDTSGVMICAKNTKTQRWLQKQFSGRKVKKDYVAMIEGVLDPTEAIIDAAIERNPKKPQTFRVGETGRSAQTHYKIIESDGKHSIVELKPTTGRTHQLRVHMQYMHHPIVGDRVYGSGKKAPRLFLHARRLELTLPSKKRVVFEAPNPKIFDLKKS